MSQRAEAPDSLDWYPTPLWATRALAEHVIDLRNALILEPACGDGGMVRALREYGIVAGCDIHDYGAGFEVRDFLWPDPLPAVDQLGLDWVVTNPPFRLAEQFIRRGLEIADIGVAMLVRSVFAESVGRYEALFRPTPPAIVAQFVERVPMVKGRLDKKASTATSYAWMVWTQEPVRETRLLWIPPCRKKLERAGDYPDEIKP